MVICTSQFFDNNSFLCIFSYTKNVDVACIETFVCWTSKRLLVCHGWISSDFHRIAYPYSICWEITAEYWNRSYWLEGKRLIEQELEKYIESLSPSVVANTIMSTKALARKEKQKELGRCYKNVLWILKKKYTGIFRKTNLKRNLYQNIEKQHVLAKFRRLIWTKLPIFFTILSFRL